MKTFLLTLAISMIAGIIDILPMLKMKLDKYSISSAFIFYFIMPFIIFNTSLFDIVWWLKGGIITLILAIPTIIIVAKEDKKSISPMIIMSVILGTGMGFAGHFLKLL